MIKGSVPSTKIGASEHVKEKTKTNTGQTKRRHDHISHLNSLYQKHTNKNGKLWKYTIYITLKHQGPALNPKKDMNE